MSLKAFHVVFVTASILLAFFFGVWALRSFALSGSALDLVFGILSLGAAVGLIFYGRYFLRKLKHISYL